MKIGFFDSGAGGMEILRAVRADLPQYDYLYYGDTAKVPYGERSEAEVYELTKQGVRYLFDAGAALVVLACNTASAETARKLQQEFLPSEYHDRKLLGVIIPTVETIATMDKANVTLLGTTRTIDSKKYEIELAKLTNAVELQTIAVPALVPLIESKKNAEAAAAIEQVLERDVREGGVVVMACTHYSLLKEYIKPEYKEKYSFVYQTDIIPKKLETYLERHIEIKEKLSTEGTEQLHFTGKAITLS